MVKEDELELFSKLVNLRGGAIRDAIGQSGIPHKRCWYLLEKWVDKGLYEYGVTLDMGWFTDKGRGDRVGARN